MNLYLIERNGKTDWGQYKSAVVIAKNKCNASEIHPGSKDVVIKDGQWFIPLGSNDWMMNPDASWVPFCKTGTLKVILLGKAIRKKHGVVVADFHAG